MAYISLYRKWRPQTFAEVVGQEHIVQTLTNALETGRVAHAYLFSGPRGTGKTSFARLLAKGLNCVHGPTGTPCNECDNCMRITRGTSVDVIEIDGASNRGIDEIRELRDRVKYAPTEGLYKVYIIDEVHMLTNEAFNALLKVLEEPPEHVIFVFATTEAHKVPATILSRCQKFDFRRFSTAQLMSQLEKVSKSEGVEVEPQALALIARHAEGGMRDALAILDQCVAANGQHITVSGVTKVLGVVRREALAELAQHILDRNLAGGLQLIHSLFDEGVETRQLLKDLSAYMRELVLLKAAPSVPSVVTAEGVYLERMQQQVRNVQLEQLLFVVDTLTNAETEIRWSTNPALAMELTLVKATAPLTDARTTSSAGENDAIKALERRIARLEEALRRGVVPQPEARQAAPSRPAPGAKPDSGTRPDVASRPDLGSRPDVGSRPDPNARPEHTEPPAEVQAKPKHGVPAYEEATPKRESARAKSGQAAQPERVVGTAPDIELLQAIKSIWPELLATLKKERYITLEAFLRVGTPGQVQGKTLVVYFTPTHRFHQANVDDPKHKTIIEQVIKRLIGKEISIVTATGTPPAQILAADAKTADAGRVDVGKADAAARADVAKMDAPASASTGGSSGGSSSGTAGTPGRSGSSYGSSNSPFESMPSGSLPADGSPVGNAQPVGKPEPGHLRPELGSTRTNLGAEEPVQVSGSPEQGSGVESSTPEKSTGEPVGEAGNPLGDKPPEAVVPEGVVDSPEPKADAQANDVGMALSAPTSGGQQDVRQSPSVQKALHLFGGRIVEVRYD